MISVASAKIFPKEKFKKFEDSNLRDSDQKLPIVYTKLIKFNLNEDKEAKRLNIRQSTNEDNNHSVPMNILNNSITSSNPSIVQNVEIDTSVLMNEDLIDIKHDHVRYLGLVSILCCWCFPFTGIPALIYTQLMKKFYGINDMIRAKRYLVIAEKLVLMTFFFGFTLIAITFAVVQVYFFDLNLNSNATNDTKTRHYGPYMPH